MKWWRRLQERRHQERPVPEPIPEEERSELEEFKRFQQSMRERVRRLEVAVDVMTRQQKREHGP